MSTRVYINHPIITTKNREDFPSLEVDGIDVTKEFIFLRRQNEIFKRILLIKNICTEEELNDIENSINMEEKLTEKR